MRSNNVLGIIFSASCDRQLPELTNHRTTASVPIGGKYRMIDFALSNMTNSNINNVGIIAKSGFMSLMDHVGSGKAWDLSKKHKGVTLLPPYSGVNFANEVEQIYQLRGFFEDATEEYVLLTQSNIIANIDYTNVFKKHSENDADITVICKNMPVPEKLEIATAECDEDGRVSKVLIHPEAVEPCNWMIGTVLIKKELLMKLVHQAIAEDETNFPRLLQKWAKDYKIFTYDLPGHCVVISSTNEYFKFNMSLMDKKIRQELTNNPPIYTKVRDDTPSRYGLDSSVKNSLVASGCVIDGTVENCVISKGVTIAKGATVSNCIIMQDTEIGEDCNLNYVIIDKDVIITNGKALMGTDSYPIYIAKKSVIK